MKWELCEHSWSDTSIYDGDRVVCTKSIYDEATEETQDELESQVSKDFRLISMAPEMLELLEEFYGYGYDRLKCEKLLNAIKNS